MPLILLHGYPLNRTIWKDVLPFLTDIADVITPDLRGHGQSPIPEGEYSMETMAADVIALMDSLGIETAVIAGHSMGGYVTLALLKYHPRALDRGRDGRQSSGSGFTGKVPCANGIH